jgi:predicted DNA-binding transcriptional regulator AlpA
VNPSLPPDVLADVAQALYAVQDPESAVRASRAEAASLKRSEVETVLGALLRARVVAIGEAPRSGGAAEPNKLMSRQQVGDLFGLRKSATYDLTQRPDFPPPVVISPKCLRWPAEEVLAFAEKLRHRKDTGQPTRRTRTPGRASGNPSWPTPGGRITGRVRPARKAQVRL